MKNGFYVIEGVCCAGKSTFLEAMRRDNITIIPETNKMVQNFPPPPTNYCEARDNERYILNLEIKRCEIGLAHSVSSPCFADRMLPSVIAISYAYSVKRGYNTINDLFKDIIQKICINPHAFHCDLFVYLKVRTETVISRNARLTYPLDEFWVSEKIINAQIEFYKLYEEIMRSQNWLTIQVDEKSTEEIQKTVSEYNWVPRRPDLDTLIKEYTELCNVCKEVGLI